MLQLNKIQKTFDSAFEPVLKGITFELVKGDFCVIIGCNGSGKSTLIKTISGEYQSDSGTIFLNDRNITRSSICKRAKWIGCVSQDVTKGTVQEMTLLENLCLSQLRGRRAQFSLYQKNKSALKRKISSLDLGLEQYLDMPMSALSGGQRQMVATIMAILSSPTLLLLDEHCSALDPKVSVKVMDYTVKTIKEKSITTLMITHNLNDALLYGNRLIMLHQGKIVLDVRDHEKNTLTSRQLLDKFHYYEDVLLVDQQQ